MKIQEAIKSIESYRDLKKNWNGYNAEPFSEKIINKALELVKQISPTPDVFPTGRNSIQFEWESDGLYLEMEIYEDKITIFNEFNQAESKSKEGIISIGEE